MTNIFSHYAYKYYENGYNVLPVEPFSKAIKIKGWQQYGEMKLHEQMLEQWVYQFPNHNIGVALGKASGLIALDFDYDADGIHQKVEALLEGAVVKKKGRKGFTAFYRYNGEVTKRWRKNNETCVELLSGGTQTVIPPSIHPDTSKPYEWLTLDTLENLTASDLTYLPEDFIENVDKLFGYDKKKKKYSNNVNFDKPQISEVEHALSYIPCESYTILITIGMALKEEYGDNAFSLWDNWARKSPKYNPNSLNYQYKWSTFGNYSGNRVGIGTVFHEAMGFGYVPLVKNVFDDVDYQPEFMMPKGFKIKMGNKVIFEASDEDEKQAETIITEDGEVIEVPKKYAEKKEDFTLKKTYFDKEKITAYNPLGMEFPQHLLDHAPGLPGELAKWINTTSLQRQPVLALGIAICAAGTLYAQKIASDSNLRTNFMVLGIAESGGGKDHGRQAMSALFRIIEQKEKVVGRFASDSSVATAINKVNGKAFAMLDEIGLELKALMRANAGNHEAKILAVLMEIFSSAGSVYYGKEYADAEKERVDIVQPCLNIYGTTTAKPLFDALTSDQAIDGFLARWLIFQSTDIDPIKQERGNLFRLPESLISYILKVNDIKPSETSELTTINGNQLDGLPQPCVIYFTDSAKKIIESFRTLCNNNRIEQIKKGINTASIWSRTCEHAIKLALVSHDIEKSVICEDVTKWACELAFFLSNVACRAVEENISDNEYEATLKRVYGIITRYINKHKKPITGRELAQRTKGIKNRDLSEILLKLQTAGMINMERRKNEANGSITEFYNI